jgi:hypothetical protein
MVVVGVVTIDPASGSMIDILDVPDAVVDAPDPDGLVVDPVILVLMRRLFPLFLIKSGLRVILSSIPPTRVAI